MEPKNILITGATGTVGIEVLKQFATSVDKYNITAFDIKTKQSVKKLSQFKNKIKIVFGDISNINDVKKISKNKDFVIHLAAIIPPLADEKPELAYKINTQGTKKLIKQLEQNSPDTFFLFSSSISVYGDRLKNPHIKVNDLLNPSIGDEYAITKIEAENIITSSNLNWSIFRLCAIMGGHKISKLMFHQPLETSLEIATPEDTARAFVNAIDYKPQLNKKIFNLGGGEKCRIIYKDFLEKSFEIYGLGKLDFPVKAFAEKNFHCGYYTDGKELEDILHFRNDTLNSYFEKEKTKITTFQIVITSLLKKFIKKRLLKKSEPYFAFKTNNKNLIKQFFN